VPEVPKRAKRKRMKTKSRGGSIKETRLLENKDGHDFLEEKEWTQMGEPVRGEKSGRNGDWDVLGGLKHAYREI